MTEMVSGPLVLIATLLALDRNRAKLVLAGCLAGLAIYIRYQNGLIAVALLAWLLIQRRRSDAFYYATGAMMTGFAGGLLDLFTWGGLFHSFFTYMRFNLIEGRSADFGIEPMTYYFETFWSAVGISSLALVIGLWEGGRRAIGLLAIVLLYVAAHSFVAHKEFRFIMPIMPLTLTLSGVGLSALITRFSPEPHKNSAKASQHARPIRQKKRRAATEPDNRKSRVVAATGVRTSIWVASAVLAAAMAWTTVNASFNDFGQRRGPLSGPGSVWHTMEDVNRLLWAAGADPDLCGLALGDYGPIWTGGYTYLHRDVPIVWVEPIQIQSANYVLARAASPLPEQYKTIKTIGEAKLARRAGTCIPPPTSYSRQFPK
jgi:hypothetical protein